MREVVEIAVTKTKVKNAKNLVIKNKEKKD